MKLMNVFLLVGITMPTYTTPPVVTPHNLVNLLALDNSFVLDIRYATTNNFTGKQIYTTPGAFLHKNVAEKLSAVQKDLKPCGLGIKIWDAYRPHSAQWTLWNAVSQDLRDKHYVGNPNKGSNHNRGAAVDITLITLNDCKEVVMPTGFDDFTPQASWNSQDASQEAIKNRDLLITTMHKHGFVVAKNEWWHFNSLDCGNYPVLDIPFESITT
jgi:D-alanyl-D-alanine dipeptidase